MPVTLLQWVLLDKIFQCYLQTKNEFYLYERVLMLLKVSLKQNIENVSLTFPMLRDALTDRLPIIIGPSIQ